MGESWLLESRLAGARGATKNKTRCYAELLLIALSKCCVFGRITVKSLGEDQRKKDVSWACPHQQGYDGADLDGSWTSTSLVVPRIHFTLSLIAVRASQGRSRRRRFTSRSFPAISAIWESVARCLHCSRGGDD